MIQSRAKQSFIGCSRIDSLNINIANSQNSKAIETCLSCPLEKCLQKNHPSENREPAKRQKEIELTAQCLNCKTMETVSLFDGRLQDTSKFVQIGSQVYHFHDNYMNLGLCQLLR